MAQTPVDPPVNPRGSTVSSEGLPVGLGCLVLAAIARFIAASPRARGDGGFKSTTRALIATLPNQLRMFGVEPADFLTVCVQKTHQQHVR